MKTRKKKKKKLKIVKFWEEEEEVLNLKNKITEYKKW